MADALFISINFPLLIFRLDFVPINNLRNRALNYIYIYMGEMEVARR